MPSKWYIGESRAKQLLKFAQGVLARYAYQIPYERFLSIWNEMRSTIPLWVEERRGPRHPITGDPLFSEEDYKTYIEWWIYNLATGKKSAPKKEAQLKGSYIKKIFGDPAEALFGARIQAAEASIGPAEFTAGSASGIAKEIMAKFKGDLAAALENELYWGPSKVDDAMARFGTAVGRYARGVPENKKNQIYKIGLALNDELFAFFESWDVAVWGSYTRRNSFH